MERIDICLDRIDCEIVKDKDKVFILRGILDNGINWRFIWGDELPQSFLLRIINSSLWNEFKRKWEGKGLTFDNFKKILLNYNNEQIESVLYVLSGDNRLWYFGEGFQFESDYISEFLADDLQEKFGLDYDKAKNIINEIWFDIESDKDFNDYYNKYKKEWEGLYKETVNSASNWKELETNLQELSNEIYEQIMEDYRGEILNNFYKFIETDDFKEILKTEMEEV